MTLFIKRGNCLFGNQIQTLLLLLDLDLLVFIVIFLLASKSCLYRFPVSVTSYTSLGQTTQSKTYATLKFSHIFQFVTMPTPSITGNGTSKV